jgi:hypothetical protein
MYTICTPWSFQIITGGLGGTHDTLLRIGYGRERTLATKVSSRFSNSVSILGRNGP